MVITIEDQIEIEDPLKEEDIQVKMEDHLIEGGIPIGIEGLLEEENILEEDPLMEMEDPSDLLVDKDHWDHKDLLDQ